MKLYSDVPMFKNGLPLTDAEVIAAIKACPKAKGFSALPELRAESYVSKETVLLATGKAPQRQFSTLTHETVVQDGKYVALIRLMTVTRDVYQWYVVTLGEFSNFLLGKEQEQNCFA